MTTEEFGPFMVEQRKKHNLTQTQLAEKLHVSTAAVSKWERGRCLPEVTKFQDIAEVFNLSLMEVMQCRENDVAKEKVDEVIADSITLAKDQYRRKTKLWAIAIAVVAIVCLCIHYFPVYHVLQVWSPSYFTTGEVSKLFYIGSKDDLDTASLFVARANVAFSDLSTPETEIDEKYGLLSRYATNSERGGKSEKHSLRLWSADFDSADGYGYVWVYYSNSVYDDMGEEVCGSRNVPALWIFEKDGFGNWQLIYIKEHP